MDIVTANPSLKTSSKSNIMSQPKGRIILLESPNPLDVLQGRTEIQTLAAACRLIGYETASFTIKSRAEFKETCTYLSTIDNQWKEEDSSKIPLFVHVSSHGNNDILSFGTCELTWNDLCADIVPLCRLDADIKNVVLSISACGAGNQKTTNALSSMFKKDKSLRPPAYLFVTEGEEVIWDDAAVAWVMLYHLLGKKGLDEKTKIQQALDAIKTVSGMSLLYFRWDKSTASYKRYPAKPKVLIKKARKRS